MYIKSFKNFCEEGIKIQNGDVVITTITSPDDIIKISMGKNKFKEPFVTHTNRLNFTIYSAYGYKNKEEINFILRTLKGKEDKKIDPRILNNFIKRTAIYLWSKVIKNKSIDIILTIKSSSDLNNQFAKEFADRIPNVLYLPNSIHKNEPHNIIISNKASETQRKKIEKQINIAKERNEPLEMKKIPGDQRNLISNFMTIDKNILSKIKNKNILIVDDFLTTGTTFADINRILKEYNPNSIYGVTIFKQT